MPSKGIAQTYTRGFFIFSIKDDSELIVALFIDIIWMAVCAGSGDPLEPEELIVALFIDIIWMAVCAGSGDPPEPEELIVALFIDIIWMAVCAGSGDPPEPEELIVALQDLENSASSDAEVRSG